MPETLVSQICALRRMTLPELQKRWSEVFGEETTQHDRCRMWRKLASRLQEDYLAGLSTEDRAAVERYRDELRCLPPDRWFPNAPHNKGSKRAKRPPHDRRLPGPGSSLTKLYKGREITVQVLDKGFEYRGHVYRSLSGVARQITGTNWNGYTFFGLTKEKR